jgi:hypothetical protein
MKSATGLLLVLALTAGPVSAVATEEAGALVAECVAAIGGEAAIAGYSDFRAEGEVKLTMYGREFNGKLTLIQQGSKQWQRMELMFGKTLFTSIQAYDGEQAFADRRGTVTDMPTLNFQSDIAHTFALLVALEAELSLARTTEIDGSPVIGVEISHAGKTTTFYIDQESQTVAEMVFEDYYFGENDIKELLEKRIRFSDYRVIDGVLFPTRQTFFYKGSQIMEYRFDTVVFHPQVPADRFDRPDEELDLRYGAERLD